MKIYLVRKLLVRRGPVTALGVAHQSYFVMATPTNRSDRNRFDEHRAFFQLGLGVDELVVHPAFALGRGGHHFLDELTAVRVLDFERVLADQTSFSDEASTRPSCRSGSRSCPLDLPVGVILASLVALLHAHLFGMVDRRVDFEPSQRRFMPLA